MPACTVLRPHKKLRFYTVFKKRKKSEFFIVFPYGRRRHERSSELYAADSWLA
jgi:hypothetical protein